MPSCLGSCRERQRSFHLLNDLSKRGPHGTGCGLCHTRVSLNEVQIHVSHRNALNDRFLEHVIPKDGLSSNVPVCLRCGLSGRSFLRQFLCLNSFCQMKVCRCEVREIPKDGRLIVQDDLNGRSF
jgi:hypothetical protein